ncbi:MAG: hypothetical protein GY722_08095 [bacterium]|nr:hypothetical protein [bacterium]
MTKRSVPSNGQFQRGFLIATAVLAGVGLFAAIAEAPSGLVIGADAAAVITAIAAWLPTGQEAGQSDLIAEVSHELRTPLTGILGTLELLTDSTIPLEPSEVDELLLAAHGDANHLLHVVSNLHARSRLDRAVLAPDAVPVNLRSSIGRAVGRSPQVASRSYLSPGDQAVAVGDAQLIMQVVTNLVQNIERYASEGDVRVSFSRSDNMMKASFADSGVGVPAHRAERIFDTAASTEGLGLGLSLSRQLARAMGGDLTLDNPGKPGAVFTLSLPASDDVVPAGPNEGIIPGDRTQAHSPRARLLVNLAEALDSDSLDQVAGGITKIYRDLLGATGSVLFVPRSDGGFYPAGPYSDGVEIAAESAGSLKKVLTSGNTARIDSIDEEDWGSVDSLGGNAAMLLPVRDGSQIVAILAVGWKGSEMMPSGSAMSVSEALAQLTASAIARTSLARDVVFERRIRASVMDELPIAVSVFAGDPPEIIDWNRKERELLGFDEDGYRPSDLAASQHLFNVRFADGTPLTIDNAPVTTAIRTGKAAGPFILVMDRVDGTLVHTRTYCAPFKDDDGKVVGAVVTSEPMDLALSPQF